MGIIERVVPGGPLMSLFDEPPIFQESELMRNSRLRDTNQNREITHATGVLRESIEHFQARWIAEGLKGSTCYLNAYSDTTLLTRLCQGRYCRYDRSRPGS